MNVARSLTSTPLEQKLPYSVTHDVSVAEFLDIITKIEPSLKETPTIAQVRTVYSDTLYTGPLSMPSEDPLIFKIFDNSSRNSKMLVPRELASVIINDARYILRSDNPIVLVEDLDLADTQLPPPSLLRGSSRNLWDTHEKTDSLVLISKIRKLAPNEVVILVDVAGNELVGHAELKNGEKVEFCDFLQKRMEILPLTDIARIKRLGSYCNENSKSISWTQAEAAYHLLSQAAPGDLVSIIDDSGMPFEGRLSAKQPRRGTFRLENDAGFYTEFSPARVALVCKITSAEDGRRIDLSNFTSSVSPWRPGMKVEISKVEYPLRIQMASTCTHLDGLVSKPSDPTQDEPNTDLLEENSTNTLATPLAATEKRSPLVQKLERITAQDWPIAKVRLVSGEMWFLKISAGAEPGTFNFSDALSGGTRPIELDQIVSLNLASKSEEGRTLLNRLALAAAPQNAHVELTLKTGDVKLSGWLITNNFLYNGRGRFIRPDLHECTIYASQIAAIHSISEPDETFPLKKKVATAQAAATQPTQKDAPATTAKVSPTISLNTTNTNAGTSTQPLEEGLKYKLRIEQEERYFNQYWRWEHRTAKAERHIKAIQKMILEKKESSNCSIFEDTVVTFNDGKVAKGTLVVGDGRGETFYRLINIDDEVSYHFTPDHVKSMRFK